MLEKYSIFSTRADVPGSEIKRFQVAAEQRELTNLSRLIHGCSSVRRRSQDLKVEIANQT